MLVSSMIDTRMLQICQRGEHARSTRFVAALVGRENAETGKTEDAAVASECLCADVGEGGSGCKIAGTKLLVDITHFLFKSSSSQHQCIRSYRPEPWCVYAEITTVVMTDRCAPSLVTPSFVGTHLSKTPCLRWYEPTVKPAHRCRLPWPHPNVGTFQPSGPLRTYVGITSEGLEDWLGELRPAAKRHTSLLYLQVARRRKMY